MVKQISVFVENRNGRLAEVLSSLKRAGINIYALHVADTTDYGIIRLIADQPEKAQTILLSDGFTVALTAVLAVSMDDHIGALCDIVQTMKEADVAVEYIYAFAGRKGTHPAIVIVKPENMQYAAKVLEKNKFRLISIDEV